MDQDDSPVAPATSVEALPSLSLSVLENISDALYTLDREWRFTYVNARGELLLRRFRAELLGKIIWEEYPHAVDSVFYQQHHLALETQQSVAFEAFSHVLNTWLFVRVSPFPQGLSVLLQDITERKTAETERQERAAIIDSMFDAVIGKTLDGIITSWNPSAETLYGYTAPEAIGQHIALIVPPERSEELLTIMARLRQGELIEQFETVRRHKNGTHVLVEVTISPIRNALGDVVGASSIAHDITERKQAEEILRAREARLNSILLSAMDAIISIDEEQRIVLFNAAAERMFACPAADAMGANLERFLPLRFRERHAQHIRNYGQTGITHRVMGALAPLLGLRANGEEFPIEATISQITLQEQKLYTVIIRDITERKRLEEQFLQSQKMEGIGRLAGGIAHDFNNLLAAILGYTELAELEASETYGEGRFQEYLANVAKAAERAASLTQQLLAFARKQVSEPQIIDLNDLLLDLKQLLLRLVREDIALQVFPAAEPAVVRIDPSQFSQVIINLVVNARDAMPTGGELTIAAAVLTAREATPLPYRDASPGPAVLLRVADTGTGMTDTVKAHLFEPFFTTKEVGKGTGLGLATSYGIVKQSGGDIEVESQVGQGTTFRIYLPLAQEAPAPLPALRTLARMPLGTETILFVEDDPLVRGFAVQVLRSLNYTVLDASDGEEAWEMLHAQGSRVQIDLLVTDLIMPRLGGYELALRLRKEEPTLKVLYCSGYTDDEIAKRGILERDVAFLQKPYSPSALAIKLRQVLDASAEPGEESLAVSES